MNQPHLFFLAGVLALSAVACSAKQEGLSGQRQPALAAPSEAITSAPENFASPPADESSAPAPAEAPTEAVSPEAASCTDQQLSYKVVKKGFTYIPDGDTSQASYAVVVRNPSRQCSIGASNVSVDFTNARGEVVDTEETPLGVIPPGATAALADFVFVKERPTSLIFRDVTSAGEDPGQGRLRVTDVRFLAGEYDSKITGRVHSTLDKQVDAYVAVVIERQGRVVGGAFTYATVPHNGVAGFSAGSLTPFPRGDTYSAYASTND